MRALVATLVLAASPALAQPKTGSGSGAPVAATGAVTGTVKVTETNGTAVANVPVVVYVVGPAPAADKPQTASIVQLNKAFNPDLLAVTVGDSVTFPNKDTNLHNVFSPNPKFDLGSLKRGEAGDPKQFKKPGVVDVYCNIHPQMAATILVLPNRHHTATKSGTYKLEGIPPGEWTIFAYARRATKPVSMKIKVVAGATATANLAVVRGAEQPHTNKYGGGYDGSYKP
jgi:plastocyanin